MTTDYDGENQDDEQLLYANQSRVTDVNNTITDVNQDESKKMEDDDKLRIYHVKKNQINSMAGFFYGLGCSLVHLSLLIGQNFVKKSNRERARNLDQQYFEQLDALRANNSHQFSSLKNIDAANLKSIEEEFLNVCESQAADLDWLMTFIMVIHVYSIFICLYRELFEVRIGTFGGFMKILEVVGVYLYLAVLILCLSNFTFWLYPLTEQTLNKFAPVGNK